MDYSRICSPYAAGTIELRRCLEAKNRTLSINCRGALEAAGYLRTSRLGKNAQAAK
jgi:hypothetical protein